MGVAPTDYATCGSRGGVKEGLVGWKLTQGRCLLRNQREAAKGVEGKIIKFIIN